MIVAKCPMRISLAGGGSDLESYRQVYGSSAVLSFSVNLYTYVTVFRDVFGQNTAKKLYNVYYSKTESVQNSQQIKNDIARVCAQHFSSEPFSCWFTSDIPSHGSGLASSSSYTSGMLLALSELENASMSSREIIDLTWKLEKKFNDQTGFQDPYGCALGGLNFLEMKETGPIDCEKIDDSFLDNFNMFLLPTQVSRSSTEILKSYNSNNFDIRLLESAYEMRNAFLSKKKEDFVSIFREVWRLKKRMTPEILNSHELINLDQEIESLSNVLCHRLIGAGGGGYFFLITKKNVSSQSLSISLQRPIRQIFVDNNGLRCTRVQ